MQFSSLALSATLILSAASAINAQCATMRTRYECRELPEASRKNMFAAFKSMIEGGRLTKYIDMHVEVTSTAHGVPEFLPWHREYLARIEKDLGADLCYWDWASDAQAPEASTMHMSGWFGSDGKGACVKDAFWSSYQYQGECISSQWDGPNSSIGAMHSIDYIAKIISDATTYDGFRVPYEGTAHARVHNGIGAMFSKMMSPANPLFFMHHANVDRHWAIWQWAHPSAATDFPKATSTQLPVFNVPVSNTFDTRSYCYVYSNMDIISAGRSKAGLNRRSLTVPVAPEDPKIVRLAKRHCDKCGEIDADGYRIPCDDDRSNLIDLRAVKPTPEWWLKMNNINCTAIRDYEAKHDQYIMKLNQIPGYVSPSALYNRPKLLSKLVQDGKVDNFVVYDKDHKKVSLPCVKKYQKNPEEGVKNLRENCAKNYEIKSYDDPKLVDSLRKTVGPVADCLINAGKKWANKGYEPIKEELEYCEEDAPVYGAAKPAAANKTYGGADKKHGGAAPKADKYDDADNYGDDVDNYGDELDDAEVDNYDDEDN
jgi:tyrosinase